jgi:hypothetical protein
MRIGAVPDRRMLRTRAERSIARSRALVESCRSGAMALSCKVDVTLHRYIIDAYPEVPGAVEHEEDVIRSTSEGGEPRGPGDACANGGGEVRGRGRGRGCEREGRARRARRRARMSWAELMVAGGNVASRGRVRKAITWGMAEEDIRIGRRW